MTGHTALRHAADLPNIGRTILTGLTVLAVVLVVVNQGSMSMAVAAHRRSHHAGHDDRSA